MFLVAEILSYPGPPMSMQMSSKKEDYKQQMGKPY
jgi:hypothetical protein